jgi:hypothetical protein
MLQLRRIAAEMTAVQAIAHGQWYRQARRQWSGLERWRKLRRRKKETLWVVWKTWQKQTDASELQLVPKQQERKQQLLWHDEEMLFHPLIQHRCLWRFCVLI